MLDTIKLFLEDYELSSDSKITIQPTPYKPFQEQIQEPVLAVIRNPSTLQEEHILRGNKAYLNTNSFQFDLTSKGGHGVFAGVKFSVPKVYTSGKNNFYSVGKQGTRAVLKKVEQELAENGIKTNLMSSKISRADLFKNVESVEKFQQYSPVFDLLSATRKQKSMIGTTYNYRNKSEQFCIYDKINEMKFHKIDTSNYPENIIRFEHRLFKIRNIKNKFGVGSVKDLLNNYEDIKQISSSCWEKGLFRHDISTFEGIAQENISQEFKVFKQAYGDRWFSKYLQLVGANQFLQTYPIEIIREAVLVVEADNCNPYRKAKSIIDKLVKSKFEIDNLIRKKQEQKTVSELYSELRNKLLVA